MLFKLGRRRRLWMVQTERLGDMRLVHLERSPRRYPYTFDHYYRVLAHLLRDYRCAYVSQYVETPPASHTTPSMHASSTEGRFGVEAYVTAEIGRSEPPDETDRTYAIHVAATSGSHDWCRELMGFGMTTLPNVVYGSHLPVQDWRERLDVWNQLIASYFRLETPVTSLRRILDTVPLLCWGTDNILLSLAVVGDQSETAVHQAVHSVANELGWEAQVVPVSEPFRLMW